MSSFAELGVEPELCRALLDAGITEPFPIQTVTLADGLAGRDVCGRAPTGSGKTLAYGLALLQRVERAKPGRPRALILVPTRELAGQVASVLMPFGQVRKRWVTAFYGGAGLDRQIRELRRGVDVAVATPGRLRDLINRGDCDLSDVDLIVIDEADRMADMGFTPQVRWLLDLTAEKRQVLLFSATLDGDVNELIRDYLRDPVRHEAGGDEHDASRLVDATHYTIGTKNESKFQDIAAIARESGRAIIFVKNRFSTERTADALDALGVSATAMHGGLTQSRRRTALAQWADGKVTALVATDVAARGVHVDGVDLVVHVDPPQDHKDYVHRSGRTARAGAGGVVVSMLRKEQRRAAAKMYERLGVKVDDADLATVHESLREVRAAQLVAAAAATEAASARRTILGDWSDDVDTPTGDFDSRSSGRDGRGSRDRGEYRGNRDARGGYQSGARGPRQFSNDRGDRSGRGFSSDRPSSGPRSFGNRDRGASSDRFGGASDRERFSSDRDRPAPRFERDAPSRSYGSERPAERAPRANDGGWQRNDRFDRNDSVDRSDSNDRNDRSDAKPFRSTTNHDRTGRPQGFRSDRGPSRPFGDRPDRDRPAGREATRPWTAPRARDGAREGAFRDAPAGRTDRFARDDRPARSSGERPHGRASAWNSEGVRGPRANSGDGRSWGNSAPRPYASRDGRERGPASGGRFDGARDSARPRSSWDEQRPRTPGRWADGAAVAAPSVGPRAGDSDRPKSGPKRTWSSNPRNGRA